LGRLARRGLYRYLVRTSGRWESLVRARFVMPGLLARRRITDGDDAIPP
jgi:hypothetical protein